MKRGREDFRVVCQRHISEMTFLATRDSRSCVASTKYIQPRPTKGRRVVEFLDNAHA